jgi:hypothetical protein
MLNTLLDERIPGALLIEPRETYDAAVIGVTFDGRAIYDKDQVVLRCIKSEGMSEEDAWEWHEFNTFCAYVGPKTPLYVTGDGGWEGALEADEVEE